MVLGLLDQLQVFSVFLSDRIAGAFNRSGAPRAVALDISQAFDKVWHAGLLHKPKSYGISGQIFDLISSFISTSLLYLDGKLQEYPVNSDIPQGPFLFLHFFYYTLITFLMILSVILISMLMIILSSLSVINVAFLLLLSVILLPNQIKLLIPQLIIKFPGS